MRQALILKKKLSVIILLAVILVACSDKALRRAAKAIDGVATANDALAQLVISEQKAGNIPEADARIILNGVCTKVAAAVTLSADVTAKYTQFPADARPKLAPLLQPILDAVKTALDSGILGIKNPQAQANVRNTLLTIQTGILAAQAALGGK